MSQEAHTVIFTTISGLIGGITKAISAKPLWVAFTFGGLSTVVIYATSSSAGGYFVKKILDKLSFKISENFKKHKSIYHVNE